jgi:hypothetical protein
MQTARPTKPRLTVQDTPHVEPAERALAPAHADGVQQSAAGGGRCYTTHNIAEFVEDIGFLEGVRPYVTPVLPMWKALPKPMVLCWPMRPAPIATKFPGETNVNEQVLLSVTHVQLA